MGVEWVGVFGYGDWKVSWRSREEGKNKKEAILGILKKIGEESCHRKILFLAGCPGLK